MAYRILIPQPIADEGLEELKKCGHEIVMGSGASEEDLIRDVTDCDAILLRTAPVTRKVIEAGKRLKIVARHGAGYNNVDLEAASERGIWVTNARDATTGSVSEFVLGAMIMAARRISLMSRKMAEGDFFFKDSHKGVDLESKVLSIIGLGRIGSAVARRAHYGLDMKVQAYARHTPSALPDYITLVDRDAAFSTADFVTLHVPLTDETRGFISTRELSLMKPTAYLINCARGAVVDEPALIRALEGGQIAGAFLDVLCEEPPSPDNPLLHMDNVTFTPHMASNTIECRKLMAVQAASQINLVLAGKRPTWPVNRPQF